MCYNQHIEGDVMQDVIGKLNYQDPTFAAVYPQCLNWVNTECDVRQLKAEVVQYAASLGLEAQAQALAPNSMILIGKIAYCLNRGAKLAPSSSQRIRQQLEAVVLQAPVAEQVQPQWEEIPSTANGRKLSKIVNCMALLDNVRARFNAGRCDIKAVADETRAVVRQHGDSKPVVIRELVRWYQERLQDASSSPACRKWVKPLHTILNTLNLLASNGSAVKDSARKARKRLAASTSNERDRQGEKAARKVRVQQDNTLGIKSVDPKNVIGATAAVLYNTRTHHIELYVATEQVLSMQGRQLVGWDSKVSMCKTLRKPDEILPHWSKAGSLTRLFVLGNSIRGKQHELTGKITAHHVILKVM
jgi:hypothetical protein